MDTSASSARPRRLSVSAVLAFFRSLPRASAAMFGAALSILPTLKPAETRQSDALTSLAAVYARKMDLLIWKERLASDLREAQRQHRPTSSIERQLRAINAQLLSIG